MSVEQALRFYASVVEVSIIDYCAIAPTNRTPKQKEEFLGATMVRSSIFGNGDWELLELARCKLLFLTTLKKDRFVLLTVYRSKTGKYDADIGVGGSLNKGETPYQAARRELKEETGKNNWEKGLLVTKVIVEKKNENWTIFAIDCDVVEVAKTADSE
jgi:8-oxo-dGTP pyrophosphatase MutT (NUDIX family)